MNFIGFSGDIEGASATAAAAARTNVHNDQRQPRQIMVENFANKQNTDDSSCDGGSAVPKGILPFGSRETTPANRPRTMQKQSKKKVSSMAIHLYKSPKASFIFIKKSKSKEEEEEEDGK